MRKTFKVVKIINEHQIVVNAGSQEVTDGQVLEIYMPGSPIKDPDTGEDLGALDYVKATVYVATRYEKMCICKNNEKELSTLAKALYTTDLLTYSPIKNLPVNTEQMSGGFEHIDKRIQIGDLVRPAL